ncbi:MAG: sigma-70 family RNA polymerase sigma factor [Ruminococcus sp.]|nr:sigma-70 family RNA polymerase sigma factor [Ruminococcus sp.]
MKKNDLAGAVEGAKRGDKAAFERLYNEYYDKLYFFVLKNVGKREAAEDITQETFLQSMEGIKQLEKPENYVTWLHSIAYHKCTDLFRNESRTAYFDTDEEKEQAMENVSLNEPIMLPDDYAVNKERSRQLKSIIDDLKPDMRSAVILYYYDDMSVSDTARALGLSDNAAKQKLFQARKKIKEKISKLFPGGAMLCSVPVGDMLHNTVTPKYAAAARASSGAAVGSGMLVGKIAGISAAAIIAVGVPIGLSMAGKGDGGLAGDVQPSSSYEMQEELTESTYDLARLSDSDTADDSSMSVYDGQTGNSDTVPEDAPESYPDEAVPAVSGDDSAGTDSSASQPEQVEMSVDKMLSMDGAQLRALSGEQFEIVNAASTQGAAFGIKCAAFPEYVFVVNTSGLTEGEPETPLEYPGAGDLTGWKYTLGDTITQLDLYEGAYVGSGVTVGMTYNEIEEQLGQEINVSMVNSSLGLAAWVEIDGRYWALHFDLTEEQSEEVYERLNASAEGGQISLDDPGLADLSDMDPVCDIAVFDIDIDNWHYGRT